MADISPASRLVSTTAGNTSCRLINSVVRGHMIATLPLRLLAVLILLVGFTAPPIAAQSPNTATMIVVVTDETGAIVTDAKVSVTNSATGALREAISGSEGSATVPALSLTGTYTVSVPNPAFDTEERKEITLRAGRNGNIYRQ